MPIHVVLAAAAVAASVPLLWWSIASSRQPAAGTISRNLATGVGATDLRTSRLQRSARERTFDPAAAALARKARRITPIGIVQSLEHKLARAGQPWPLERVLAAKLALVLGGGMFGFLSWLGEPSGLDTVLLLAAPALGYVIPDTVIGGRAQRRQLAIQKELPDTLDQVTVSVEAGLGFEASLARVAQTGAGPLAEELARTLQDIQLGVPRRDAMDRLLDRTDVDDLRRFVHAMRQAEGYGIPIGQVLRVQSAELRDKRRQRAEETAMKLPVKIIFPVIFCILPALFVVIIGPFVIRFVQGGVLPS